MTTLTQEIELEPISETPADGKPLLGTVLPFLSALKVLVSVRVGGTETSVAELAELKQGAVLTLDRSVEEPLDLLVEGHLVARGVLVAVGENFGVRITETAMSALTAPQR